MSSSTLPSYHVPQLEAGQRAGSDAIFNSRSIEDVLATVQEWNAQRVLLVHSRTLATISPHINNLKTALSTKLVAVKDSVGSHSPYKDVMEIAHMITDNKIDCVVCIGGGSYSDACKSARLLSVTLPAGFGEAEMEALVDPTNGITAEGVMKKAENVKLILVPTSLSAGEWNWAASATNSAGKKQHFALKDGCAPDRILMDPWLAKLTPERLWSSSGIRAVDHCVEMLCNPKIEEHRDAQEWCATALADLARGLVSYKEGLSGDHSEEAKRREVEGISKCQAGSRMALMSLITYRVPMGASHAIGHQLGSVAGVLHGITSCIMLPAVLRHTKGKTLEAQEKIVNTFNKSLGWQETEAADCVERLVKILDLPNRMSQVGVTETEQIEKIIDMSMTDAVVSLGGFLKREEIAAIVYSVR